MKGVLIAAIAVIATCLFAFSGERAYAGGCGVSSFGGYGVSSFNSGFYPQSTFVHNGFNRQFVDNYGNVVIVNRFGQKQVIQRNFRSFNRFNRFRSFGGY